MGGFLSKLFGSKRKRIAECGEDKDLFADKAEESSSISSRDAEEKPAKRIKMADELSSKLASTTLKDNYLNYPFLTDEKSISWIKRSKIVFICRGLPGSGKSTLVKKIVQVYPESVCCSADHFFLNPETGEYDYDRFLIKEAHADCQAKANAAMESAKTPVIVDNTHVLKWEMGHYLKKAAEHGYLVIVCEPKTPWAKDVKVLAEKNSHGVTENILREKIGVYKRIPALYYAWFVNRADSKALLDLAEDWLAKCFLNCPEFKKSFSGFSAMLNVKSAVNFYSRKMCLKSNKEMVHCTAKFCGNIPKEEAEDYDENVTDFLGRSFTLKVIGFVITPRTFGARVKLEEKGQHEVLYGQPDDESVPKNPDKKLKPKNFKKDKSSAEGYVSKSNTKDESSLLKVEKVKFKSKDETRFQPMVGKGRRAHITLGTADNIPPVETGFDAIRASNAEQADEENAGVKFEIENAVLKSYKDNMWVIYPETVIKVDSIFTGHY